jgi:NADPH oxidase
MKNSLLTLLFGIPFERALWYHKVAARLAYINGVLHTYVSYYYPDPRNGLPPPYTNEASNPDFLKFLVADSVNSGGTMIIVFMTAIIVSALPFIRRKAFEFFYYLHIIFSASMVGCAFYHTGILIPILGALTWGLDLAIRKVGVPCCRYPRKACVRIISASVVEVCFPKAEGFDYNPGQYVYLAVPELSVWQWHPFSLSSSPEQKIVTIHIRKAGSWTSALYELAKKKSQVSILLEGPYGSVGVDLSSDRYKMIMLFSGGIG